MRGLDAYITGNWGEDQFRQEDGDEGRGTMTTRRAQVRQSLSMTDAEHANSVGDAIWNQVVNALDYRLAFAARQAAHHPADLSYPVETITLDLPCGRRVSITITVADVED